MAAITAIRCLQFENAPHDSYVQHLSVVDLPDYASKHLSVTVKHHHRDSHSRKHSTEGKGWDACKVPTLPLSSTKNLSQSRKGPPGKKNNQRYPRSQWRCKKTQATIIATRMKLTRTAPPALETVPPIRSHRPNNRRRLQTVRADRPADLREERKPQGKHWRVGGLHPRRALEVPPWEEGARLAGLRYRPLLRRANSARSEALVLFRA